MEENSIETRMDPWSEREERSSDGMAHQRNARYMSLSSVANFDNESTTTAKERLLANKYKSILIRAQLYARIYKGQLRLYR